MIVMKFGGTSVADAQRIRTVAGIVGEQLPARPVVVVSALGGVTDLLVRSIERASEGDLEGLEPLLADVERRHRWAVSGAVEQAERRHQLSLEIGRVFEELRAQLRSIRVLGEGTARAADAVLACGEGLSSRIVAAAFRDAGLPARWIDSREVMITDERFGAATPDAGEVARRAAEKLTPAVEAGTIPVLGGFVGATRGGETTTIGRGGSDTTATVVGLALGAAEIQIWTDVEGMMTADPRRVPAARRLERLSFAEAAEFARFGARVLHPASIAPAVRRQIPVRVLNTLRPGGSGTRIVGEPEGSPGPAGIVSREGATVVRTGERSLGENPASASRLLGRCHELGLAPELALASHGALALVLRRDDAPGRLAEVLRGEAEVDVSPGRGVIAVIGAVLGRDAAVRGAVLAELARWGPELVVAGAGPASVAAVLDRACLDEALAALHARFIEGVSGRDAAGEGAA